MYFSHNLIKITLLIAFFLSFEVLAISFSINGPNVISELSAYTAKYKVLRGNKEYGNATRALNKNTTSYSLSFNSNASMLFYSIETNQTSTFLWQENKITPLSYQGKDARTFKDDKNLQLNFNHEQSILTVDKNGQKTEKKLSERLLDPLLVYEMIRFEAIANDNNFNVKNLEYRVQDQDGVKEYHFINSGQFVVDTLLGELKCIKLSRLRKNSSRKTHIWLAIDYDYIPVMILQENNNEEIATLVVTSIIRS
ncbi:DUF3108 domain-containing protein [Pseudoalteromonas phenolica]|uniref:DUF3108 domain-containing protein n=1 Tax=Pseudoalteromonas phenolica TaxID=161398 RepID=A0A5R9Q135_9GAMM|nr:DUF3108 domain-containing protein [Pseudoalteromonas phenolica]TLX46342.1 DUF3108 domain-containing protein [Pseudoalteromonas phenolica]